MSDDECEDRDCRRRWTHVSLLLDYVSCEEHAAASSVAVRSASSSAVVSGTTVKEQQ